MSISCENIIVLTNTDGVRNTKTMFSSSWIPTLRRFSSDTSDDSCDELHDTLDPFLVKLGDHRGRNRSAHEERRIVRHEIISELELRNQQLDQKLENLKLELEFRRAAGLDAAKKHKEFLDGHAERFQTLRWKYEKMLHQDIERRSSLGNYVSTMRGVTGPGSMYVHSIEGQACRSMHLYRIRKNQRDLLNRQAKEFIQHIKRTIYVHQEEKALLSKNIITRTFEVECELRSVEDRCRKVLHLQRITIDKYEAHLFRSSLGNGTAFPTIADDVSKGRCRIARRASLPV
jgi:hypothetical protein